MKTSLVCSSLVALMASSPEVSGFTPLSTTATTSASTQLKATSDEGDSRRQFLSQSFATYSAAALASTGVLAPLPANAASAEAKINQRLKK